ncbi:uncharacterized protein METZ01_LOCUS283277, partial [marine metagenome]
MGASHKYICVKSLDNNYIFIYNHDKKRIFSMNTPINFQSKFDLFLDHWSPKIIAEMNDCQFKLVKIKGQFTWHEHKDTDEVFIVINGSMGIEF